MRLAVVAGIVGAVLFPVTAESAAAVPRGFVGVMADGPLFSPNVRLGQEVDLMASSGVEAIRVGFYWNHAQPYPPGTPPPPGYVDVGGVPTSFAESDRIVAEAARRHLSVLPVVLLAPPWARENRALQWSPPALGAHFRYAIYLDALVRRYQKGGTFWAQRPRALRKPIHAWQVWNEPNGPLFWMVQPGLPRYAQLLQIAHAAIKRADPKADVVLAGLTDRSWESLSQLYGLGIRDNVDAVALNSFSAQVSGVVRIVRRARAVMARNGDAHKPILVTETSWPSGSRHLVRPFGFEQTEQGQASKLRRALYTLARERTRLGIRQVFWYTWMSYDRNASYGFDWAGVRRLERSTVRAKPAYFALRQMATRLAGCGGRPSMERCRR